MFLLSNCGGVNPVVFLMSTNETNEYQFELVLNRDYHSILVAFDIEHDSIDTIAVEASLPHGQLGDTLEYALLMDFC